MVPPTISENLSIEFPNTRICIYIIIYIASCYYFCLFICDARKFNIAIFLKIRYIYIYIHIYIYIYVGIENFSFNFVSFRIVLYVRLFLGRVDEPLAAGVYCISIVCRSIVLSSYLFWGSSCPCFYRATVKRGISNTQCVASWLARAGHSEAIRSSLASFQRGKRRIPRRQKYVLSE